jgi:pyrimidine-nucleoside phosphorylase
MDQPLGWAVGNALEVKEAIETLRGNGPPDFVELCLALGAQMLIVGGLTDDRLEAEQRISATIADGSALAKLAEFVAAQGGDADYVRHPEKLPQASIVETVPAPTTGYVERIVCDEVGRCSVILGGGRLTKESSIDLSVGIVLEKKVGDSVYEGESLGLVHGNDPAKVAEAKTRLLNSFTINDTIVRPPRLVKRVVE